MIRRTSLLFLKPFASKDFSACKILLPQLSLSSRLSFSSQTQSSPPNRETASASPIDDDIPADVSTQELKQRIGKYLQGDTEALPSIFEAILARKLSGKHEDTDDELMEEFRSKTAHEDGSDQVESDESDEDLCYSGDELSD